MALSTLMTFFDADDRLVVVVADPHHSEHDVDRALAYGLFHAAAAAHKDLMLVVPLGKERPTLGTPLCRRVPEGG
jgi:hypothetical protein